MACLYMNVAAKTESESKSFLAFLASLFPFVCVQAAVCITAALNLFFVFYFFLWISLHHCSPLCVCVQAAVRRAAALIKSQKPVISRKSRGARKE